METNNNLDPEVMLRQWRARILNGFITLAAAAASAGTVVTLLDAFSNPGQWLTVIVYAFLALALVVLAIFRKIDNRIRSWGVLLVAYATGLAALTTLGLGGSGRLYLLSIPIIALILLGVRPGIIMSALSLLVMLSFALLARYTTLLQPLIVERNSLHFEDWVAEGSDTLMLLAVVMTLLIFFYRLQERLIAKERQAKTELLRAQALLEEQKANLEQKIKERTEELLTSNKIQMALFKITESASAARDVQEFFARVHQIVGELMYAGNIFIARYDDQTGLLSFPYFVDEMDAPFPTQPLENFHGMTSYVIRTGESIKHGWDQFNELVDQHEVEVEGTYNVDGIGAPLRADGKIIGAIFVQSYTREIHYTSQDDETLAYVAQHIATAITRLSALEAERQRNNELAILNSLSEEMVKTLDVKTMTRLVGDKIREIFDADSVMIMLLDRQTNLISVPYEFDRNEGGYIDYVESFPMGTGLSSKVITTGQPLMLGTLEEEVANGAYFPPEIIEKGSGFFSQSWLGVPIIANDQILGLVALADARPHAFTENHLRLLQTLSANMGMAIENARLFQSEQQRAAELAIINGVQNSVQSGLAAHLDMQAIYELVGDKVCEIFHANTVVLVTFDLDEGLLYRHYTIERGIRYRFKPLLIPAYWYDFIRQNRSQIIKDHLLEAMQQVDPDFKVPAGEVPKCAVTVPLRIQGKLHGAISLQNVDRENAFTEADLHLLETLANNLSAALENARLFDETQRLFKAEQQRVAELQLITSIQQGLAAKLDFQSIVDLVGDKLREVFQTGDLSINWLDEQNNLVHYLYVYEHGGRLIIPPLPPQPSGLLETMRKTRQPIVCNTVADYENARIEVLPGTDQSKSLVDVPIISSNRVLGALVLENYEREYAYGAAEVRLLTTIAGSLGASLENVRLFDETQRLLIETEQHAAELAILNNLQSALTANLDFQAIVDLVGDKLREVFYAPDLAIYWLEANDNLLHCFYRYDHGARAIQPPFAPLPDSAYTQLVQTRQPLVWNTAEEGRATSQWIPGRGPGKSGVMLPIISKDRVVGVIQLENYEYEQAFAESQLRLLTTIAASLGVALENAYLFSETQRLLKETEQHAAELQIITSVQAGLASKLEMQAIYDLVGDKIRDIFNIETLFVAIFDQAAGMDQVVYGIEDGQRLYPAPGPLSEFEKHLIRTRKPVVINDHAEQRMAELGMQVIPETEPPRSGLWMPLITDDSVRGVISLQSVKHENAFSPSNIRLLEALANSMSVALENARLFAETQRLLNETEQHNTELAIINSVQEGLASKLDTQAIYELIGAKVGEVFGVEVVDIVIYDSITNLISMPYSYEGGDRSVIIPQEPYGFRQHVLESGQPILINRDFLKLAEAYDNPLLTGDWPKSALYVPILVEGKAKGVISIQDLEHEKAFSQPDVRLLQTLVNSMTVALEQARLFDETQRLLKETEQRNSELAIINSVQEGLASKLEMQAIYNLIGDEIRDIFNAQVVMISTYHPLTETLEHRYAIERGERVYAPGQYPLTGFRKQIVQTRQPVLVNTDVVNQAARLGQPVLPGTGDPKSWLGVPMFVSDQVTGILSLQNLDRENAFTESDVRLLQTLANAMSVAIENARLFDETQRLLKETEQRNSELAILNSIGTAMSRTLDVKTLVRIVGDKVHEIFNSDGVVITLLDRRTNLLHRLFEFDKGEGGYVDVDYIKPYPLGKGMTSKVILSRQPLSVGSLDEQAANGAYFPPGALAQTSGNVTQSWLGVPIVVNDQALGVVQLGDYQPHAYNENHVRLLQTLSSNMGVAIENARLFEEEQQRAAELAAVNTVSAALTSELDLAALIPLVGQQTRALFNADIAYVALLDEPSGMINFPYTYGEELPPIRYGMGLTSKIIATNQPLLINQDVDRQTLEIGATVVGQSSLSYLGVPITVSGRAVGVLSVQSTTREGIFSEKDARLLATIASNVGTALRNAQLFNELKREKQVSQEAQQRFADIISFLPDAVLVIDREGQVIAWNRAMEEMTGVQAAHMLGKGDHEYSLPFYGERRPLLVDLVDVSPEELEQNHPQIQRQGSILFDETYVPHLREEGRYLQTTASMLNDSRGAMMGAIEIIRDITDKKRAESELYEAAEKLRLIFENAFDGIDIYEEFPGEGKRILLDCNDRYCELAGRSREELMAVENTGIFQRSIENPWDEAGESILNRKGFAGVFSWIRPDGRENIIEYNAAPTRVGERFFTIGLDRDVTERMRTQKELQKARIAAEQANLAKSAFLANMSHELRTPLNAIIGFTRIVRRKAEGVLAEKQTENLDKVLVSAEHLLNLINTVLDIAKIEAGRMDVLAANFRVIALVDLCANTAQPLLRPGVTLEKQVDEALTLVCSDQDKIRQIVLNLLSNAAKFTHAGKITLSARQEGDHLHISVADTGIGISDEALPRIFKEFQQADTSTTRQYGGTGLGLSISRNLARLLGGDILVQSELGRGSTFTLIVPLQYRSKSLPLPEFSTAPTADIEPATDPEAGLPSGLGAVPGTGQLSFPGQPLIKKHLLVIDDDPDAVYLLQENLNQQEYLVVGTRNGQDGLRLAREQKPDAILLDIIMPGADGWQVLHALKADPVTAEIPVILLTIVDKKALGFRLGAAAYLLKPLDPIAVREALNRVILKGDRQHKHILVVDDDPSVADMLRQFLPEAEFKLDSALDGLAGLDAIATNRPDILLLDLMMPRLDGFGVIERLRADPGTRDLPIIVISAKDLTVDESARLKESVTFVMQKQGFQGEKLVEEINSALKN